MKVKKPPMPLWQKIFYCLSFLFLIIAFIYLGTKNYDNHTKTMTDAESFAKEYAISNNNIFKYITAKETLEMMNQDKAIIFMAFPENKFSSTYAKIVNEVAIEEGITEVYYYNFLKDRKNNNHYYEGIVDRLSHYTSVLDDESLNIYAPTLIIMSAGNVLFFDNEAAITKGVQDAQDYWHSTKIEAKKTELKSAFNLYKKDME